VLCVGIIGWTLAGRRRRRELLRLRAAGHSAFLQQRRAGMRAGREAAQHDTPRSQQLFKSRLTTTSSCCSSSSSSTAPWPPLAVVLPVKGCRPHSTENWASQLAALYGERRALLHIHAACLVSVQVDTADCMRQHSSRVADSLHALAAYFGGRHVSRGRGSDRQAIG
jgi:hypothetical protein